MNFIKRVLSTVVGIFVFLCICFLLLFIIGAIAGSSSSKDKVLVKNNSVLELNLSFPMQDNASKTIFKDYPFLNEDSKTDLFAVVDAINYAATDDKIKGISIDNNISMAGISQLKAIRDALVNFKESGKFITAYGDIYTQKDYYLASVADTLYLNPVGMMEFKGLQTEILYYKDFQEKSGLKMEVVKVGTYKSAVEPFLENNMSEANREQITVFLNSIWNDMKTEIASSRNLTIEQLNTIADNLDARTPEKAVDVNLIDKIAYHDQYVNALKHATGLNTSDKLKILSVTKYAKHATNKLRASKKTSNKLAVIYAEGSIIYGEGKDGVVGNEAINKSLKKAREDKNVKAIVLRVNSPGGSALASELMWREIELTKKVKPVIVSMGNLAASGGYYIACNADKIFAQPTTITGSIGVFGTLPNARTLAERWGINAEQVTTNKNATTYSVFEPLNENQRAFIKEGINSIYDTFKARVAEGRNMSLDAVETIAQGRVWTGNDALKNGLVDELGGLDQALAYAAKVADIDTYKIKEYPVYELDIEDMLSEFGLVKTKKELFKEELGEDAYNLLIDIKQRAKQKGAQLVLPYSFNIK